MHDFSTNIDQSYDGDSQPVKRVENRSGYISTIYYVRSSVLGGQPITELTTAGINSGTHKTHVYVNGSELAIYDSWFNLVLWRQSNPVTGSGWQETDPLGGLVGFGDPFPANPDTDYASLHPGEALFFQDANPFDIGSGCTQDEMPTDCSRQTRALETGTVGIRVGLGRNIYAINNYQHGLGGFWRSVPTPDDPASKGGGYDEADNTFRMNMTNNAYADEWVPFGSLFGVGVGVGVGTQLTAVAFQSTQSTSKRSGCDQLVDYLMDAINSSGASVTQRVLGVNLALAARGSLAEQAGAGTLPWDGIRENLVAGGQNGWAWVHVAGIAGAALAGHTGRIDQQFSEDRGQLKVGQDFKAAGRTSINYAGDPDYSLDKFIAEKQAEIDDDHAGVTAGDILSGKINGKLSYTNARVKLTNLLCK